jgi:hypothetical protein
MKNVTVRHTSRIGVTRLLSSEELELAAGGRYRLVTVDGTRLGLLKDDLSLGMAIFSGDIKVTVK